jgi:hypothetical protein
MSNVEILRIAQYLSVMDTMMTHVRHSSMVVWKSVSQVRRLQAFMQCMRLVKRRSNLLPALVKDSAHYVLVVQMHSANTTVRLVANGLQRPLVLIGTTQPLQVRQVLLTVLHKLATSII